MSRQTWKWRQVGLLQVGGNDVHISSLKQNGKGGGSAVPRGFRAAKDKVGLMSKICKLQSCSESKNPPSGSRALKQLNTITPIFKCQTRDQLTPRKVPEIRIQTALCVCMGGGGSIRKAHPSFKKKKRKFLKNCSWAGDAVQW
jgi:hypothetical protein